MRGQDTLPLHGEHRSAMNRTNRVSGENNSTFIPTNEEVEKKQPEAKSSKNLGHSSWIKAVFTGVSGKGQRYGSTLRMLMRSVIPSRNVAMSLPLSLVMNNSERDHQFLLPTV